MNFSAVSGRMGFYLALVAMLFAVMSLFSAARAERIKDLSSIAGVRSNQLIGYGLVVGLSGTGDKMNSAPYTEQSLRSMLTQLGVVVPPGTSIKPKNVAAVTLHAELPAFARPGQKIDITASSVGDAKSLRGGTLLMSPLKGADGKVYAIAQGNLVVGGLSASGADGRILLSISPVSVVSPGVLRWSAVCRMPSPRVTHLRSIFMRLTSPPPNGLWNRSMSLSGRVLRLLKMQRLFVSTAPVIPPSGSALSL